MPPVSQQQRKFFRWAAEHPEASGVSPKVSAEFNDSDPGGHLPARVHHALGGGAFGLDVTHADPLGKLATPHTVTGLGEGPHPHAMTPHGIGRVGGGGFGGGMKTPGGGGGMGGGGDKMMSPSQGTPWWTRSEARMADSSSGSGMGRQHFDVGGGMSMSSESPWWERSDANSMIHDVKLGGGLIPGSGAGRTDQIPATVPGGSHIVTADVISGMGQGNTAAGARNLTQALRIGPYGVPVPQKIMGHGPPRAPAVPKDIAAESTGGHGHHTSVLVASGEYVVPTHDWLAKDEVDGKTYNHRGVRSVGRDWYAHQGKTASDAEYEKKGHDLLDDLHKNVRKFNIKWLKKAPPPKK